MLDFFWGTAADTETGRLLLFGLTRDTPGLDFVDTWDTMSMRGTGSWDVVCEDVFVPSAVVQEISDSNDAELVWDATRERGFAWFAMTIASIYLGVERAAVRFARDRITGRTVTGASLPMARQPAQIFNAAQVEVLLRPAEALVADGLHRRESGMLDPTDLNTIKYVAVNAADEAVDRCIRMTGGQGIFRKFPLERYYRDVRAGQFHPPNNDVALETIGKAALGIDPRAEPRWPSD